MLINDQYYVDHYHIFECTFKYRHIVQAHRLKYRHIVQAHRLSTGTSVWFGHFFLDRSVAFLPTSDNFVNVSGNVCV